MTEVTEMPNRQGYRSDRGDGHEWCSGKNTELQRSRLRRLATILHFGFPGGGRGERWREGGGCDRCPGKTSTYISGLHQTAATTTN
jgi:hypothetical protein